MNLLHAFEEAWWEGLADEVESKVASLKVKEEGKKGEVKTSYEAGGEYVNRKEGKRVPFDFTQKEML